MCILFLYANSRPVTGGYKLIVASNRDWYYSRPSVYAKYWKDYSHVIGGLDMEAGREGGTWLAISGKDKTIKLGALLSVAGESRKDDGKAGRGFIVKNYVVSNISNTEFCESLMPFHSNISAYNFVSVEFVRNHKAKILLCSNKPPTMKMYNEGKCHGFGNSSYTTPFEKIRFCKDLFKSIVNNASDCNSEPGKQAIVERCLTLLKDRTKYWPDNELSRRAPIWGEYMCSPHVEILKNQCGTRARTVILVDADNKMDFIEEAMTTMNPKDKWNKTHIQHTFT